MTANKARLALNFRIACETLFRLTTETQWIRCQLPRQRYGIKTRSVLALADDTLLAKSNSSRFLGLITLTTMVNLEWEGPETRRHG